MTDPIGYVFIVCALVFLVAAVFRPLRQRSRLGDAEDRADLAETEHRIEKIERDAHLGPSRSGRD